MTSAAAQLAIRLRRPDLWTGERLALAGETIGSGYPALDEQLPGGGWPRGALVELLAERPGIGELALLLPTLAALTARDEWGALLRPQDAPRLHAPAWQAAGVHLARLIVVALPAGDSRLAVGDAWWAAEQLLRAGSVTAALLWLPRQDDSARLRRLQVAAEAGGTLAFLFGEAVRQTNASPAPLRLRLSAADKGLSVFFLKRRGAPLARPVILPIGQFSGGRSEASAESMLRTSLRPPAVLSSHALAGLDFSSSAA